MTKAEKIAKLIEIEHPVEAAVQEIVSSFKHDFDQLEDDAIPKETRTQALTEMEASLRQLKDERTQKLTLIYERFDDAELDALIFLHESAGQKLKSVLHAAHDLKWDWANNAVQLSPTMNGIIVNAGVNWMVNNTEGEVAESIATQPLEDLTAGQTAE